MGFRVQIWSGGALWNPLSFLIKDSIQSNLWTGKESSLLKIQLVKNNKRCLLVVRRTSLIFHIFIFFRQQRFLPPPLWTTMVQSSFMKPKPIKNFTQGQIRSVQGLLGPNGKHQLIL